MSQLALVFRGPDVTPTDRRRLGKQLLLVKGVMSDGAWRTLAELEALTGAPQASVSARIRDLRASGLEVLRERVAPGSGQWRYRVVLP